MKRSMRSLILSAFVGVFLAGCAITAQEACMTEWGNRHKEYTEDEKLALFYGAKGKGCNHEWFLTKDEKGNIAIAYDKIKLDKVLDVDLKKLKDLDEILDPKNEQWHKLLVETGLRPEMEAEERALKYRVARLKLKLNFEMFRKFMGEVDENQSAADERRRSGYNVRIFLPEFDPAKDAPFNAKYVDEAKREGRLVLIGKTIVFDYEKLGKKDSDPDAPADPNRFVWKEVKQGLEIGIYKVMDPPRDKNGPRDKRSNYLEATRIAYELDESGKVVSTKRESKPALRAFASPSEQLDIVILDTDREGDLGFGLPDVVEKLASGIASGKSLYLEYQPMLARLFEETPQAKRIIPPPPAKQKFDAVAAGTPVDPWEKSSSPTGWTIPHEYKSEKKDNYSLQVVFKPKKPEDSSSIRQIDFIAKAYHIPGKTWSPSKGEVIEYYRPLAPFNQKDILEARVDFSNKKKITIEREGQSSVSAIITPGKNIVAGDTPVAIDFSDGEKRWRIADKEKKGIFTHRMEISTSTGLSDEEQSSSSSNAAQYGPY